jgi:hypothetical protein
VRDILGAAQTLGVFLVQLHEEDTLQAAAEERKTVIREAPVERALALWLDHYRHEPIASRQEDPAPIGEAQEVRADLTMVRTNAQRGPTQVALDQPPGLAERTRPSELREQPRAELRVFGAGARGIPQIGHSRGGILILAAWARVRGVVGHVIPLSRVSTGPDTVG